MAVEAQVCPQCGAAVQFAPGQTEVICGHCGTTVAKTAAPGAATVEKELADEVLIQAMVAREHKLHAHGRPAAAKIVSTQVKNIFRNTLGGRSVVIVFALEVQPDGEPAFTAEAQALVGLVAVEKYKPGILLNVKFDPQDNSQVAIDGRRGSDGNTVKSPEQHREDRAKKREAKEQAQLTAKQAAPAATAAAPLAPAWSQPASAGGSPVAVPAEFEAVTDLGQPASVHTHQAIRLLSNFGTPRANVLVRYHDGLAYRAHGAEIHTWRWEQLAAIQSNVTVHTSAHSDVRDTTHEYTVTTAGGAAFILDDVLTDIEPLITAVKRAVYARLAPPLVQRYQAGEALAFGPVSVQREHGLQLDGQSYAWAAIQDIQVHDGRLKLTLRAGQKHEAHVSAIPNVELLCQLIGVKLDSEFGLGHWV